MTVSTKITKRIYGADGRNRCWEVDFPLISPSDLAVFITSPQGEETRVEGFDFNASSGMVTYPADSQQEALPAGWRITLVRQTPLTQEMDLLYQGELDAEVLERGYDKLVLSLQELDEKLTRGLCYPVSFEGGDASAFLKEVLTARQQSLQAADKACSAEEAGAVSARAAEAALAAAQSQAETARYYAQSGIAKCLGEVYESQSAFASENPGALPLFTGDEIQQASQIYPDFWAWLLPHEELWVSPQAYEAALASDGVCPYYALEASTGFLRLPKQNPGKWYPWVYAYHMAVPVATAQAAAFLEGLTDKVSKKGDVVSGPLSWKVGQEALRFEKEGNPVCGLQSRADNGLLLGDLAGKGLLLDATDNYQPYYQKDGEKKRLISEEDAVDYIVESFRGDGVWYEVYKSGKIRQGGTVAYTATREAYFSIQLPKPMKDASYWVSITGLSTYRGENSLYTFCSSVGNVTEHSFLAQVYGLSDLDQSVGARWLVEGVGA